MKSELNLTEKQKEIADYNGSAFITACPGAGKTHTIVGRVRNLLNSKESRRGIALLSFSNATVDVFKERIVEEGLLSNPVFPNFIGTFDSFLWQFLITPFGIPEFEGQPRLWEDKGKHEFAPRPGIRTLKLELFDRKTGKVDNSKLRRLGFKLNIKDYELQSIEKRKYFVSKGMLDHVEIREKALDNLERKIKEGLLPLALSARFREIIVDETQDCNPEDLTIIKHFLDFGINVKLVCDLNQGIYGFRGSDVSQLSDFSKKHFNKDQIFHLNSNFRSTKNIVQGTSIFKQYRLGESDIAVGPNKDEKTPIYILPYSGRKVPESIGVRFSELTDKFGFVSVKAPIISPKWSDSFKALGMISEKDVSNELSVQLARAVSDFFQQEKIENRKKILMNVHKIVLTLGFKLKKDGKEISYEEYIRDNEINDIDWRPRILAFVNQIKFSKKQFKNAKEWLEHTRKILRSFVLSEGSKFNGGRFRKHDDLDLFLIDNSEKNHPAKTIHNVKGQEFSAVCVVIIPTGVKELFSILNSIKKQDSEELRKIYVGTTRAKKLLAIAVPNAYDEELKKLLTRQGACAKIVSE